MLQRFLLSLVVGISGCRPQPALSAAGTARPDAVSAAPADLEGLEKLLPQLAERCASRSPAQPFDLTEEEVARLRQLNVDLVNDEDLRHRAYLVAEPVVRTYLQQPRSPDAVPCMTRAQFTEMAGQLQPGDVIQCGNNGSFIHSAFYLGNDTIVHALAQSGNGRDMAGVVKEDLSGYFLRSERDMVVVLRPRNWTLDRLAVAQAYALAQVGKPYDVLFLTDADDRFYCTELTRSILQAAGVARIEPQLAKGLWRVVTNDDIRKSPDLYVVYRLNRD